MKKIEAIIRTSKFEIVHEELAKIGVKFMSYSEVKGIGLEHTTTQQYRGTNFDVGYIPRTRLEIAVPSSKLDEVITCLLKSAHTGKVGDGKIFVYDIHEAYRIRSGEKGDAAL